MAKVITTELQHSGASGANVTLDSSKNVTCENNLQVDGNLTVTGTIPAGQLTGTVADARISTLTASKLTGALPAISGASLTGITDTLSFRNLIVNGSMQVGQRMNSSNTGGVNLAGYQTVDRFKLDFGGTDNPPTQHHVDVAAGTTPYTLGFRKKYQITNGDQTGGAGTNDYVLVRTILEAQDIANSGWNYVSSSSDITLSFWIKSSVAQNFYGHIHTTDGTSQNYPFETGSLSANTWTKVTKTIPGDSNLQFDNNNGAGLSITIAAFFGTDYTSGVSLNQWIAYASANLTPDQTSTWYTTNDATLEITGVQLEVGSTATDFEHRLYSEELARCKRYYQAILGVMGSWGSAVAYSTTAAQGWSSIHPEMRAAPTFSWSGTIKLEDGGAGYTTSSTTASTTMGPNGFSWWTGSFSGLTDNNVYYVYGNSNTGYFKLDAEL